MKNTTWNWKAPDGVELFVQEWAPDKDARALVCLVHGLGEHSGRYAHVGAAFAEAGYVLGAYDLRGHGRSGGQRGHFPSLEALHEDIHGHSQALRQRHPGLPAFLYGHSLGGALVLSYAACRHDALAGVIATGAGLRSPVLEQRAKVAFSKALGGLLPTVTIPTGLDPEAVSRDPQVVRAYREDPLVHGVATLSAARAGIEAIERAFACAPEFPAPLLLMHGTADRLAYPHGTQEYAALVPGNCTLRLWDGLHHELHNEPEQAQVLRTCLDWIASQIKGK